MGIFVRIRIFWLKPFIMNFGISRFVGQFIMALGTPGLNFSILVIFCLSEANSTSLLTKNVNTMKYVRIITKIIQEMNGDSDIQLGVSKIIEGRDQGLIEEFKV